MNYRHGFHAGNFADVHKHAVLCLVLARLREKPAPFRVLDTHAGAGRYDLASDEAARTGEWRAGIGRLEAPLPAAAEALLAPYRTALSACGGGPGSTFYPGSPLIAAASMRPGDRLTACELEPAAAEALAATLRRDRRAKAVAIDGWTALSAYVPPKERRGVVLIDPPYEQADEAARLPGRLAAAYRKWPTGIYIVWYPVKERAAADRLAGDLRATGIGRLLRSELVPGAPASPGRLAGSGLAIVNPPWRLDEDLGVLVPALAQALAPAGDGRARLEWIQGPGQAT